MIHFGLSQGTVLAATGLRYQNRIWSIKVLKLIPKNKAKTQKIVKTAFSFYGKIYMKRQICNKHTHYSIPYYKNRLRIILLGFTNYPSLSNQHPPPPNKNNFKSSHPPPIMLMLKMLMWQEKPNSCTYTN